MNGNVEVKVHTLVVTTRGRDEIERYLYDHTRIVEKVEGERIGNAFILCTTHTRECNDNDVIEHDMHDVEGLARYQADRFASGLISARVIGTLFATREAMIDSL